MRLSLQILFLTFVLAAPLCWAAPNKPAKKKVPVVTGAEFDEDPGPTKKEPTQVIYPNFSTPDDALPPAPPPRPPRGINDLNMHFGLLGGDMLEVGEQRSTQFFGVRWVPREGSRWHGWDYTANVHFQRFVTVGLGQRFSLADQDYFRAYYRYGVEDYIDPRAGLGGLVNMRHLKVVLALGMDDLFEMNRRFVGEFGFSYGMGGFISYLQIGYNLNF